MNYLIYPTKKMYISQSYDGKYSHIKSSTGTPFDYPIDESCGSNERDYFYCPCDEVVIKKIYGVGAKGTNTIWMSSTNKVKLANGTEDYITIMVVHPNDDTLKGIKVGQKYKRGAKMFREGNDGNATGYHFHISVSCGRFSGNGWVKNNKGAWVITGRAIKPEDAFFIDDSFTKIINNRGLNFKKLIKNIGTPVARDENKKQVKVLVDELRVRESPFGNILGFANKGIYNVLNEEINKQYTWYEIEEKHWIATNEGVWTTLYEVENKEEKPVSIFRRILKKILSLFKKLCR